MQEVKRKISKEEYDRLDNCEDLYKVIAPTIPISWECGYGWYGCRLRKEGDEYYIVHTIGDSCD